MDWVFDQKLIASFNQTQTKFQANKTLEQLFQEQVEKTPDAIAIADQSRTLTYQELDIASSKLAHWIIQHHPSQDLQDKVIALLLERSLETIIGLWGIIKAGAAYLPLDPNHPHERLEYMTKDSDCQMLLSLSKHHAVLSHIPHRLALDEQSYQDLNADYPKNKPQPQQLAYVIYTSGTTGEPKGVAIQHQAIINRIEWMQNCFILKADDIVLQKTPYTFDVSVWELLWANLYGARIFVSPAHAHQDPAMLYDIIEKQAITVLHFVPSMLGEFCQYVQDQQLHMPTSLRLVFCSGEALPSNLVKLLYQHSQHQLELHNLYGPTEAAVDVTHFYCSPETDKVMIGKPIQNIQIHILKEHMQAAALEEIGEIYIAGVGLAKEYINKPELTQERFILHQGHRLYKTGDLGCWHKNGQIEYFGRNDSQVKIRGYRIELGEIEHLLNRFENITQAVVQVKHHRNEAILIAYYQSPEPIAAQDILQWLKQFLPDYMLPNGFVHVLKFPKTHNGKVCRKTLANLDYQKQDHHIPAKTEFEIKLCALIADIMQLEQVYLSDDFFLLGGHSLTASRIIHKIEEVFHKKISHIDIYKDRSIQNIAERLKMMTMTDAEIVPLNALSQNMPLCDFQLLLWLSEIFEPKAKRMNIVARKRLVGAFDIAKFEQAVHKVLTQQNILHYDISKILPYQKEHLSSGKKIYFEHIDLRNTSYENLEQQLSQSIDDLIRFKSWKKTHAMLKIRLFLLESNRIEIQICMPHLICDETSMEILWQELSKTYLNPDYTAEIQADFKDYILEEQASYLHQFKSKLIFWKKYLAQASLFVFPKQDVIQNMKQAGIKYSSYFSIPESLLKHIQRYCIQHRLNINDVLIASLALSLEQYCQHPENPKPLFNLIKSTRRDKKYDRCIGCMIQVEPIVISKPVSEHFLDLCTSIQEQNAKLVDFQAFSSILKFAFHGKCFGLKKWLYITSVRLTMPIYAKLIQWFKINYRNFLAFRYCWRLAAFERKNIFLVNINLWNNLFQHDDDGKQHYFGLNNQDYHMIQYDLTEIDDLLDICFIRDHSNHQPYLVLSANLSQELKQSIANTIFKHLRQLSINETTSSKEYS